MRFYIFRRLISILFLVSLTGCTTNLLVSPQTGPENKYLEKSSHTYRVMPDQPCMKKYRGKILHEEEVVHKFLKICFYDATTP